MVIISWPIIAHAYFLVNKTLFEQSHNYSLQITSGWRTVAHKDEIFTIWSFAEVCQLPVSVMLCSAVLSCSVASDSVDPMDCSPPGSSVHGILQARILEWVALSPSRGSSQPRDQTRVSCIAVGFFTSWATRKIPSKVSIDDSWVNSMFRYWSGCWWWSLVFRMPLECRLLLDCMNLFFSMLILKWI